MPIGDLAVAIDRFRHLQHRYLHPRYKQLGIFRGQPGVLHTLEDAPGVSQAALARRINVRPPTATRIVDGMVDSGLVERVQDKQDRRSSRLFLTNTGLDVVRRLQAVHDAERDEVFSVLTSDEKDHLVALLRRIADRYEELIGERAKELADGEDQ